MANHPEGKGYQNEDNYPNIKFQFIRIENINVTRNSVQKVLELCELKSPSMSTLRPSWMQECSLPRLNRGRGECACSRFGWRGQVCAAVLGGQPPAGSARPDPDGLRDIN